MSYHHLITKLVIERVREEARDRGQTVDHVQCQAAVVTQHHKQGPHVSVDLVHLNGRALQELEKTTDCGISHVNMFRYYI